jgi:glycerophosphoryl diester phosphodiesterase
MLKEMICAALAVSQLLLSSVSPQKEIAAPPHHEYIIHGAGYYSSIKTTNSLEALENAYENGNRYIELDFNFTSDLRPVCIHDWNHLSYSGYDGKNPTEEEFMSSNIYSMFSPLNLELIANFMEKHEDVKIITDVKELNIYFCDIIRKEHPKLMDRFIIQVYSENEYAHISKMGFKNIIFSLYKLDWESKTDTGNLVEFAKKNKLYGYTFPSSMCEIDGYVDEMLKAGVPLFVHTVNDKSEQEKYFKMGISGIYTDNIKHS